MTMISFDYGETFNRINKPILNKNFRPVNCD